MASGNNIAAQPTPPGHVHLVLFQQQQQQQHESFYLEIPLRVITDVCRHPPKYLRYIGWCVLGVEGSLQDGQGHQVDLNGGLVDGGVYYYRSPATQQDTLSHAIDLEVIMVRSQVLSETTRTRDGFHQELATRDGERCVWTSLPPGVGMYIIPWSRGDEWLQLIIGNRPHGDERGLDTLRTINDIRNGIMSTASLQTYFDSRVAVILKTPNRILQTDDVPERHIHNLPNHSNYPTSSRYTLQWLANDDPYLRNFFPNNSDAAFVSSQKPKPSDLLLHYNYGAAAVKNWGRNYVVLTNRPGLPRPKAPEPVPMGPTRNIGDRTTAITKLANARANAIQQPANDGGSAEAIDSEQPAWDEDDVMLFCWGNSKAAMERHAKKEQECEENINKWRIGTAM